MVFCPENGDPAQVKAKLYLDAGRFAVGEGQGFLVTPREDELAVRAREGFESEAPLLARLLNDPAEGFPVRAADL